MRTLTILAPAYVALLAIGAAVAPTYAASLDEAFVDSETLAFLAPATFLQFDGLSGPVLFVSLGKHPSVFLAKGASWDQAAKAFWIDVNKVAPACGVDK